MPDRPILFSSPMVRALLEGRKTQTRRVLNPQPPEGLKPECLATPGEAQPFGARWSRGDRLWVKEAFRGDLEYDLYPPSEWSHWPVHYEADGDPCADDHPRGRLRSPIFMPRWASRLTLTVTDVRVQRLQDISEEDARAEGVRGNSGGAWGCEGLIEDFADLWDSINEKRGFGWDQNPWVVALTFDVAQRNIDA